VIPTVPTPTFNTAFPFAGPPSAKAEAERDAPRAGRYAWKATARRKARLRRAADAVGQLPAPGEAVHFLIEAFFDPADLIEVAVRAHATPCTTLRCATLSFSVRNVRQMVGLIDTGLVGKLTLLCSDWMRDANVKTHAYAVEELAGRRGATVAAARCHAKVSVLVFAGGARLVFEGSGNLSSCRTVEQVTCINDGGLADWHSGWIDRLAGVAP
jgi:hypothetical protein